MRTKFYENLYKRSSEFSVLHKDLGIFSVGITDSRNLYRMSLR